jgi:hypothetical protein
MNAFLLSFIFVTFLHDFILYLFISCSNYLYYLSLYLFSRSLLHCVICLLITVLDLSSRMVEVQFYHIGDNT